MKIKYCYSIMFITTLFLIFSCDALNEEIVSDVTNEYLSTNDGFYAGINAAYAQLKTYHGQDEGCVISVFGTDEYTNAGHGSYIGINEYNSNVLNSENRAFKDLWTTFYKGINTCNAVIGRSDEVDLPQTEKSEKVAEVRFLRAYYYFTLVQHFGPIHLTLEETVGVETEAYRESEEVVFNSIIEDLEFAAENLPDTQNEFGRATESAAKHLLALVYLTRGYKDFADNNDFSQAAELAKAVINDYSHYLLEDCYEVYNHDNEQNPQVIWSVQYHEDPLYNPGNGQHLYFNPWYETYNDGLNRALGEGYGRPWIRYRPTGWLLNCFRVNGKYDVDSRFNKGFQQVWYYNSENNIPDGASVGDTAIFLTGDDLSQADVEAIGSRLSGIVAGKNLYSWHENARGKPWSWYTEDGSDNNSINIFPKPWKFEDNKRPSVNHSDGSRDIIIFHLAETYLIAAEAMYMRDGNGNNAVEYLNILRRRAAYPGKESQMEITANDVDIDFVLDERSRELFGEQKRWLDLKRTGKLLERVKKYNPQATSGIKEYHLFRPIPVDQLNTTSNEYKQNDGY